MNEPQQPVVEPVKRCFIITPIGGDNSDQRRHANMVFEVSLKPNLESLGYSLERSDLTNEPGQITAAIFSAINEADICIADLSYLNPNVMYELGVRHALQKPVVHIASNGTKLPFDMVNQRTIFFDVGDINSLKSLGDEIVKQVTWVEGHPGQISNPLTAALGIFENSANADPQATLIGDLVSRIAIVETELSKGTIGVAPAIIGQGDLATKNTGSLQRLWRADQIALALDWTKHENGSETAEYNGFSLEVRPESKGRWSSNASEKETNFSVPWPVWQASANDAKSIIVRAVDAALSEREL